VTLVLIVVVLVFTVCQTPALATQLMWSLLDDRARSCGGFQFYFSAVSNLLVLTNSAANFPIYAHFNTRFRSVLLRQLCGCRRLMMADGGGMTGGATSTDNAGGSRRSVRKERGLPGGAGGGGQTTDGTLTTVDKSIAYRSTETGNSFRRQLEPLLAPPPLPRYNGAVTAKSATTCSDQLTSI
jgi:hypothetical protein